MPKSTAKSTQTQVLLETPPKELSDQAAKKVPAQTKAVSSKQLLAESTPVDKARHKALGQVLTQIERNFGQGSIMRLGDAKRMKVETIASGALPLDMALGGGLPKGRVIEIYGPESSGKTTLALHAI
ncbi:MAG: hypothetical protein AAFV46_14640, partial [Cyanobacteria bacterium J06635_11]